MAMTLPHDYEDSRRRFLALGAAAGAAMLSFPAQQDRIGAPPLFTDTALLDAESADTLVVIASGTHGVEGYAGAACQFRFLRAYPRGLFYGGHAPAKSRMAWEEIMHALVAPYPVALLLDLHTGLGKRGCAELMSELPQSNADFQTMSRWYDGRLKSMADNQSVSASLSGTLTSAFLRSGSGRRYALGLEFGTCSPLTVLNALRADQWLRNHDVEPS